MNCFLDSAILDGLGDFDLSELTLLKNIQPQDVEEFPAKCVAALNTFHQTVLLESEKGTNGLLEKRSQIVLLNACLKSELIKNTPLEGVQIALPKTKFEKMVEVATLIPRIVFSILIDLLVFPLSLIGAILACFKPVFNPSDQEIKKDKPPILLIHGSNCNDTQWIIGRQFLKKEKYGSVFSLSYDGILGEGKDLGVHGYAKGKVRDKIREIQQKTQQNEIILIGYSMGGLIAAEYAETISKEEGIEVKHVISIASPWHGAPIIDLKWKLHPSFEETDRLRMQQMSVKDPLAFRHPLVKKALTSEEKKVRKYYSCWSSTDIAVPSLQGSLTKDPRRQRSFNYLGHFSIVVWPSTWMQVCSWLDPIYS